MVSKLRFSGVIPHNFFRSHSPLVALVGFATLGGGLALISSVRHLCFNPDVESHRFESGEKRREKYWDKEYRIMYDKSINVVPVRMRPNGEVVLTGKGPGESSQ